MADWNDPRQAVNVVAELAGTDSIVRAARADGAKIFELQLGDLVDKKELEEVLKRTFSFPHETSGFDAAIDLISDLEWMPSAAGYLLVVRGLDDCPRPVAQKVAEILPWILERCRTGGITFVAVLESVTSRDVVAAALSQANNELDEEAAWPTSLNSTGAVLVTYDR